MEHKCDTCKFLWMDYRDEPCRSCAPCMMRNYEYVNWQPHKPRRNELRREIEEWARQYSWVQGRACDAEAEVKRLKAENDDAWKQISAKNEDIAAKDAEIAALKKQVASEKPELLPFGTRVMIDYGNNDCATATIIEVDRNDTVVPYFVRFDDGEERWVSRWRVTSIPADLLPIGTRVMLTGTIVGLDVRDDELPYKVELDNDLDYTRWFPKTSVKPLNHD